MKDWTQHQDVLEMLRRLIDEKRVFAHEIYDFGEEQDNQTFSFIEWAIIYFIRCYGPAQFFDEWPEDWGYLQPYYEFLGLDFLKYFKDFLGSPVYVDD